jgi:nicotinamide-nucleotide amidase
VYLGVTDGSTTEVVTLDLAGDRAAVRSGAVEAAFAALLARLTGGNADARAGVTP